MNEANLEAVRARVHHLNDDVQKMKLDYAVLRQQLEDARADIRELRDSTASKDGLNAARAEVAAMVRNLTTEVEGKNALFDEKLNTITANTESIQNSVTWVVRLTLGFVILALLGLLVAGVRGSKDGRPGASLRDPAGAQPAAARDGLAGSARDAARDWLARIRVPLQVPGRADVQP